MDAFDRFWQWADKTPENSLTIPANLQRVVMELAPGDRRERAKLNRAAAGAKYDCPDARTLLHVVLSKRRRR